MYVTLEQAARITSDLEATEGQYDEAEIKVVRGKLVVTYLTDAGTPGLGPFTIDRDGEVS